VLRYAVLYGASTSLPGLLQSLFGYNALAAGLVMSPAGFFAVLAMPVVSRLLGRQTDARWLIGADCCSLQSATIGCRG
jgi:DHA2 family multidrug resistance protein